MKTACMALSILCSFQLCASAQSTLFCLDGTELSVNIVTITETEVAYTIYGKSDSPIIVKSRVDLFAVKHKDGKVQSLQIQSTGQNTTSPSQPQQQSVQQRLNSVPYDSANEPRDRWGRTFSENMELHKKRSRAGIGLLTTSGATIGFGVFGLFYQYYGVMSYDDRRVWTTVSVASLGVGAALLIPGSIVMGTATKYKRRAQNMPLTTSYLTPTFIGTQRYSGAQLQGGTAMGVSLNIRF